VDNGSRVGDGGKAVDGECPQSSSAWIEMQQE